MKSKKVDMEENAEKRNQCEQGMQQTLIETAVTLLLVIEPTHLSP